MAVYRRLGIEMVRGEGCYLYDSHGKRYLDFASGIAVTGLGHCHPHLVAKLTEQLHTLWHCSNIVTIPEQVRLAQRLCEVSFADRVFFCSTGGEAVEALIKLVRKYHFDRGQPDRNRIITLEGGFHGRSMACISAGGNAIAREGFGPLLDGFDHVPRHNIEALEAAITEHTAGILLEPIQAEGGIYPLDHAYLQQVRAIADKHKLLLCFDEVQCGMGRSGSLFAYEQSGVMPDVMAVAKGIGNGFPLAALLATEDAATAFTPGTHGSTYGGNPLAMAAGNAVLDVMLQEGFFDHVRTISAYMGEKLHELAAHHADKIKQVRGQGMLWGVELHAGVPHPMDALAEAGLLITRASGGSVMRLVPPLIVSKSQVDEGVSLLEEAFN